MLDFLIDYQNFLLGSMNLFMALLLGASMGSFLTLATYRLPLDLPIGRTRSRCPHCQRPLAVRDLIPILSWALAKGRCRHCAARVSARYPLTELACAMGTAVIYGQQGATLEALALVGLWWCVVAIILTDLEHYIILDEVQVAVGCFAILHAVAQEIPASSVLWGGVTGGGIALCLKYGFLYFRDKDALGWGDVKFFVVAGLWLASPTLFVGYLFYAGWMGVASGLLWRTLGRGPRFPFGPALALTLLVCMCVPALNTGFLDLYGLLQK